MSLGKVVNDTECYILLDKAASKSFMSKHYCLRKKTLHDLLKFSSKTRNIQVGNGQFCSVLLIILRLVNIHG